MLAQIEWTAWQTALAYGAAPFLILAVFGGWAIYKATHHPDGNSSLTQPKKKWGKK